MLNFFPFKVFPKNSLGVDIGTSSVKIAELSKSGSRIKLEGYGELKAPAFYEGAFRTFEKSTLLLSSSDVAKAIMAIIDEAKMRSKAATFSIPDFSSFFTTFELPQMSESELPQAVRFEARQHIPLPLGEVILDWQIIKGKLKDAKSERLRILLVAVPNEVIYQYQEIATLSGLKFRYLEAEAFGLVRSLVHQDDSKLRIIIDVGAQSTTISVVDSRILQTSYSLDISGNELTRVLAKGLNIDFKEAEKLKENEGLKSSEKKVAETLSPLVDLIIVETEKIAQNCKESEGRNVEEIILAGGSANMPGLKDQFFFRLKRNIVIADPISPLFYPPVLEKTIKRMGPSFAVAVGMAERGLE
ncbi:MAG: hypothetical protein COX90_01985 [Candidatus Nealsonbacteria bacterium CG_4_10_14_0_2_um_filter_38_17]|uniref:SHS2 domain-containing protein n=2 Tax=Candidatus Nealsoniibacteriota TaxID=1817911 RepID=A0A2M7UY93_9BACT|nr:MAG: hypothetical protein COX36_01360 [Candidatus Nealsonbacteria bacterium CG23_combo_of_CG06-09_8_20_14_all_38_19]PIZ88934.1 MAG: hypothetical protein COX90_01985 [Candidatus Nealsonbacteria bacterium CG_4_10_14_0_2_um_filter_38_17]